MTPNASSSAPETLVHDADTAISDVVIGFHAECCAIDGVQDARVLVHADEIVWDLGPDEPVGGELQRLVTESLVSGRPENGSTEMGPGVVFPLRSPWTGRAAVWFSLLDQTDLEHESTAFALDSLLRRVSRDLNAAVEHAAATRRQAALEFAADATHRYLTETSLHRAVRLNVTELAELTGARDVGVWILDEEGDPSCLARVRQGGPEPRRDAALSRLVREVTVESGLIQMRDTGRSPHFAWCKSEGISSLCAHPIIAFDRCHGALLIVDLPSRVPLDEGRSSPGVPEAARVLATATAQALHTVDLKTYSTTLEGDLRSAERFAERHERDAAHLDLCRRGAEELNDALGDLADQVPALEEAVPESEYRERMGVVSHRVDRAQDVLTELLDLTDASVPRLRLSDLNQIIHEAVDELGTVAVAGGSQVSLRLQGDLPSLLLDPEKVRDAIHRLLVHGLSGTEDRQAVITTRAQKGDVVVEFRFPERNVPAGVLESLFVPFVARDEGGAHGLSLADQIVGEHGGQLRARSEPGDGLLYWLSLPVGENQDRRRTRVERRRPKERRRVEDADGET